MEYFREYFTTEEKHNKDTEILDLSMKKISREQFHSIHNQIVTDMDPKYIYEDQPPPMYRNRMSLISSKKPSSKKRKRTYEIGELSPAPRKKRTLSSKRRRPFDFDEEIFELRQHYMNNLRAELLIKLDSTAKSTNRRKRRNKDKSVRIQALLQNMFKNKAQCCDFCFFSQHQNSFLDSDFQRAIDCYSNLISDCCTCVSKLH